MYHVICVISESHDVIVTCDVILVPNSQIKGKVKEKKNRKKIESTVFNSNICTNNYSTEHTSCLLYFTVSNYGITREHPFFILSKI